MSTIKPGIYTILRVEARAPIPWCMDAAPSIDLDKLNADMAAEVDRTNPRRFSLAVTGGANPDFYRNYLGGQNKRLTAEVFLGIVKALGRSPFDYIDGMEAPQGIPNASVLTSTFGILLDSVGVDPNEGGRARKLAVQFPSVLRSMVAARAQIDLAPDLPHEATPPAGDEDRPPA